MRKIMLLKGCKRIEALSMFLVYALRSNLNKLARIQQNECFVVKLSTKLRQNKAGIYELYSPFYRVHIHNETYRRWVEELNAKALPETIFSI